MLNDATRIQLDLVQDLNVDKIVLGETQLKYERNSSAVFVDFPSTLRANTTYAIDFHYSGRPKSIGGYDGLVFSTDSTGGPWIYTSCQDEGSYLWWPSKDQWYDEPQEGMNISVAVPNSLIDISNGQLVGSVDLGDGYTRWDWQVHYPINHYDVALNIGSSYRHISYRFGNLTLDYYVLQKDLSRANATLAQIPGMLEAYEHYFGEYPFAKDGYKLVQVPYAGMEHQTAVAYGNDFKNGYGGSDWTGVGISLRFDFIIIHETAHEWFGNAITAADSADMWIHEAWATYMESLYVEYHYGKADGIKYLNGYKSKVNNRKPVIPQRGVDAIPPQDQYFKGALMINTLRSIVNDEAKWKLLLFDLFQTFKYQNILTEDVVGWFNRNTGRDLTPFFNQYLRHAAIPTLQLQFSALQGSVNYRWQADEIAFAMPITVGKNGNWQIIQANTTWQTMKTNMTQAEFSVPTDLYYVNVKSS
ncbi:peptidase M1 membrane alanine aminopeptidase [Thozetella sp. PMI_491]|nr:peptidase M1 membrane alanine aminopeptidase [Thozetella sp. PMI_491]